MNKLHLVVRKIFGLEVIISDAFVEPKEESDKLLDKENAAASAVATEETKQDHSTFFGKNMTCKCSC